MKRTLLFAIMMIVTHVLSAHNTGIYFYFDNVDKHVYEDDNIKMFLYPSVTGAVCVKVQNKTDKLIYVDNGSSFIYTNGHAATMYRARTTTYGSMDGSGTSVNLGGIAGALGARGPVQSALSAVTVSNSSQTYNSSIIYEKRIIPVAPYSTNEVFCEEFAISQLLPNINEYSLNYSTPPFKIKKLNWTHRRLVENGKELKMKKGMVRIYDESNTLLSYSTLVRYSFSESMEDAVEASCDNYLKAIAVDKKSGVRNYEYARLPICDQFRNAPDEYTLFCAARDGGLGALDIVGLTFAGIAVAMLPTIIVLATL